MKRRKSTLGDVPAVPAAAAPTEHRSTTDLAVEAAASGDCGMAYDRLLDASFEHGTVVRDADEASVVAAAKSRDVLLAAHDSVNRVCQIRLKAEGAGPTLNGLGSKRRRR